MDDDCNLQDCQGDRKHSGSSFGVWHNCGEVQEYLFLTTCAVVRVMPAPVSFYCPDPTA